MLKEWRIKKGLTQEQLARAIDVSLRTIYNIEKTNKTDIETALKISKILNVPIEVIFSK